MERYSDSAIEIINELHTERLDYESEYIPLINCALQCKNYEDAEEHGLLVRLPCQVKDKAFVLEIKDEDGGEERLFEGIVTRICIMNGQITVTIGAMERDCWFSETERRLSDIGTDWFLTREEAEKALEEENRNG